MSGPRVVLRCREPGCAGAWFQMSDDHGAAIRGAIKAGWDSDGKRGCICADTLQWCPEHSRREARL